MSRVKVIRELIQVVFGLVIFSYGVHLTIAADIGVAPWDCLGQGIALHTPFNYGIAMTIVSVLVLIIDVFLRQPIGYGMLIDAFLTGNLIQLFGDRCDFSNGLIRDTLKLSGAAGVIGSCLMIIVGIVFMSVGQAVYMSAAQSCGPRDTMMVGIGLMLPKVPIGIIQNGILFAVFAAGWVLGGSVGIGTVVCVFVPGIIMQIVFKLMHFEPREVQHKNILESTKILIGRKTV